MGAESRTLFDVAGHPRAGVLGAVLWFEQRNDVFGWFTGAKAYEHPAAFFMLAVAVILIESIREWRAVLSGRKAVTSTEVPFTARA